MERQYFLYLFLLLGIVSSHAEETFKSVPLPSLTLADRSLDRTDPASSVESQMIGRGYDSVTGELKPSYCVSRKSSAPSLGNPPSTPTINYSVTKLDNAKSYSASSEMSASVAYGWGGGGADARSKYLFSNKFNGFNSYATQTVDVQYPEQIARYDDFQISSQGRSILKLAGGLSLFRFVCGDSFVIGYKRGGKFTAILEIDSSTTEQQQEASIHLSASEGAGNFSGSQQSYYNEKQSNSALHIEVLRDALVV